METLIILIVLFVAITPILLYIFVKPKKPKCEYCSKELEQDEIVVYKGISCVECEKKNKILDSFDEIPGRFGVGE